MLTRNSLTIFYELISNIWGEKVELRDYAYPAYDTVYYMILQTMQDPHQTRAHRTN